MRAARTSSPSPELLALLDSWLPARRWYPLKGVPARHVPWLSLELPAPDGAPGLPDGAPAGTRVVLHLLRVVGEGVDLVVQVPLVLVPADAGPASTGRAPAHEGPQPLAAPGVVGALTDASGRWTVHDGATHPACWAALLEAAEWEDGGPAAVDLAGGRALTVEQSNSSVLLPGTAGGSMLKVLRTVAIGPNPDVTIPRGLAAQGWTGVPRPLAWLALSWAPEDEPADASAFDGVRERTAHLAVLAEFVEGARDGFDLACAYAGRDEPFTDLAADLGRVVADMHAALRDAFGEREPVDAGWLVADLRRRSAEAARSSPALARRADAIEAFWDRTAARLRDAAADLPHLQTVHGDLHLGQVLHARRFGWKVLDFEGEPLRPVAERTRPDLALRDVAGILRSLDYAAAVGSATSPTWAVRARTAFLDAYRTADATGADADASATLVRALVLDKALYEVVYESRNRPDWEPIPLAAVDRIVARDE